MDIEALKHSVPTSPAFLLDEGEIMASLAALASLREQCGCKILYSIKSLPLSEVLVLAKPTVDGFSVSSLFEARLAHEILGNQGEIHLTTPGIRLDEVTELVSICSHISCNSLGQFQRMSAVDENKPSLGLRINPQLSFTEDVRHDPCRQYSKLGVTLDTALSSDTLAIIKGLHFHTVFAATDYAPLIKTVAKIQETMGDRLAVLDWLNFGGGYGYGQIANDGEFIALVKRLRNDFGMEIHIEPGNAVVGKAGYLLATVIDCFKSDGKSVAVLDTSINHHPQVFEYQMKLELAEENLEGDHSAILVGNTCLAGDLFGEYRFKQPLQMGDKVMFKRLGAYSLVKANRFNGYNLPDVYWVNHDQFRLLKQHSYRDYRQQWLNDV